MTGLDSWLKLATRCLSADSVARVRTEIQEHYESAREAAMNGGASDSDADRVALAALGDAKVANRQYRSVLLTSAEAKMLQNGNREARAICSRPWLRWLLLAVCTGAFAGAAACFLTGGKTVVWALLVVGMGTGFLLAALVLPVYTPARARVFRGVKWVALTGALAMAFGPEALKLSWLLVSCLWPMVWIERTRASIRRKLPVGEWPKHLYL
jgi:hypothetical protein